MIKSDLKKRSQYLVSTGRKADAVRHLKALRALQYLEGLARLRQTIIGNDWIDIDRTAALENVDSQAAAKLAEALRSDDLVGRLLLALPGGDADPNLYAQTLREALLDPQFEALSVNLVHPIPFVGWVRGFASIWEEKLQKAGSTLTASRTSEVLMQLLSAMLEV